MHYIIISLIIITEKMKKYSFIYFILCSIIFFYGCKDGPEETPAVHDPSQPLVLTDYYPTEGGYLDKIILNGSNFGSDPSSIRVYFNKKKAAVVGSDGNKMYAIVPRLPGDICDISVAVGEDSLVYEAKFEYKSSVTVTTIAGNGVPGNLVGGSLAQTVLRPRFLCVDKDDHIFGLSRSSEDEFGLFQINEEDDELIVLGKGYVANVPAADPESGVITYATETTIGSFITLDPAESYAPRMREIKWKDKSQMPDNGWKHCVVVNPVDGYAYLHYAYGELVRLNLKTYEGEVIAMTPRSDTFGMTFRPNEPNILYFTMNAGAGDYANSICTIDVSAPDPESTFKRVSSNIISGGHRDGELSIAQFNDPYQMFCDSDSNIYIADAANHCIRRIRGADNIVETVVGIPGVAGWKDGNSKDALFNWPCGIGVSSDGSVYVADTSGARVRKLSIN